VGVVFPVTLEEQFESLRHTVENLGRQSRVQQLHIDNMSRQLDQANAALSQQALTAELHEAGQVTDPINDDVYTDWLYCCDASMPPPSCAEDMTDGPECLARLHPYCEYTLRFVWKVEWDTADGCLYEHYGLLTFQNGRLIHIDTTTADSDTCRQVIVCGEDCEDGSGS
jgi:hypothetical protein